MAVVVVVGGGWWPWWVVGGGWWVRQWVVRQWVVGGGWWVADTTFHEPTYQATSTQPSPPNEAVRRGAFVPTSGRTGGFDAQWIGNCFCGWATEGHFRSYMMVTAGGEEGPRGD